MNTMVPVLGEKVAMAKLGARLRAERLRRNFSQGHVASIVGVAIPTYRKIEAGNGTIEFRYVVRALGVLGYANALGDLIPQSQPELPLDDLFAPQRKHASRARKK